MASEEVESWTWYGVVVFMLTLRYTARLLHFKDLRKLQLEDYLMLFVFACYTVLIIFLNICENVNTNLIDPSDIPTLTPQDIKDRVYGSKAVLIVESMMCTVQWGTKICLLVLYIRLTESLRQAIFVKIAFAYVVITFIVMMSLYYGYWCRPFDAFWETPTPNIQCATQIHHLIVNLTFNLTSDIMIILIPLPLFVRAHLELKKKILLVFPFSLGFFTIICAILSKHLSFTQPFSPLWIEWYTREASTAMIVTNMPYSWAIIRRVFRLKSFLHDTGGTIDGGIDEEALEAHRRSMATHAEDPEQKDTALSTLKDKAIRFSFFGTHHEQRPHSTADTARNLNYSEGFGMTDFKSDYDPQSSSNSEDSRKRDMASRKHSVAQRSIDENALDKLYRLDDEAILEDVITTPKPVARGNEL